MLDAKSGASFDKDYVNGQIKDHKDTIDLLKKEIATGQDPEAKAFASQTLPTVEAHLAKINQIAASMGSK
jgi:putative membrane protein